MLNTQPIVYPPPPLSQQIADARRHIQRLSDAGKADEACEAVLILHSEIITEMAAGGINDSYQSIARQAQELWEAVEFKDSPE